jgi:hypothetical protein
VAQLVQCVEARVDVDVTRIRPVRLLLHAADAARARPPAVRDVDHQAPGEPAREVAQLRVRGTGEVGEHAEHLVGVLLHLLVHGGLVQLPHLR